MVNSEDLQKLEALSERLDIELAGFRVLGEKTAELLEAVRELEEAAKRIYGGNAE